MRFVASLLHAEVEDEVEVEAVGEFSLKGFRRPVVAFDVVAVRKPVPELASADL